MHKINNLKELGDFLQKVKSSKDLSYYQLMKSGEKPIHIKTIQKAEKGEPIRTNKLFDLLENLDLDIYLTIKKKE